MKEQIEYCRNPALPEVELTLANVKNFEFDRHIHLDYHIGAVSTGCMQYLHHGRNYLMDTGLLSTINPDEMHTGTSESENGYAGHFMAVPPQYISQICRELKQPEAFFAQPLIDDFYLYQAFMYLHSMAVSHQNEAQHLQLETVMMAFSTELLQRYAGVSAQATDTAGKLSRQQINQIKDMFHADPGQSFVLQELAEPLGLSKFQFLRQFKQSMGMTPHAYLKRIRLEYAKKALIKGSDIADVAYQVGFFDQSHLNKAFKHAYLVTPNNFQQSLL
ncbi:AraC family transcriptional regulator [Psychromonas aquimarina]|uniref:AraC family transcriptional regulator n=1 Tax=Psychromonas aquimarina TaxID=444919 RepID=UPI00041845B3